MTLAHKIIEDRKAEENAENAKNQKIIDLGIAVDKMLEDVDFLKLSELVLLKQQWQFKKDNNCSLRREHDEYFRSFIRVPGESGLGNDDIDFEFEKVFQFILDFIGDDSMELKTKLFKYSRNYGNRVFTLLDAFVSERIDKSFNSLGFNVETLETKYAITIEEPTPQSLDISEEAEMHCTFCLYDTPSKEDGSCSECDNSRDETLVETYEENENLAYENKMMAQAFTSLGFSQEEINKICNGSLIPEQAPLNIDEDKLKSYVVGLVFSDDGVDEKDYDSYMENPKNMDICLWEPFENYPEAWVQEQLENNFDSLKEFITYLGGIDHKALVSEDNINLGVDVTGDVETKLIELGDFDYSKCTSCNSSNIEYDSRSADLEGDFVYRIHSCGDCGTKFEERYTLTQIKVEASKSKDTAKFKFKNEDSSCDNVCFDICNMSESHPTVSVTLLTNASNIATLEVEVCDDNKEHMKWSMDVCDWNEDLDLNKWSLSGEYLYVNLVTKENDVYQVQVKNQTSDRGLIVDVYKNADLIEALGYITEDDFASAGELAC